MLSFFLEVIFFEIFSGNLRNFGEEFFAPPKICLLLHVWPSLIITVEICCRKYLAGGVWCRLWQRPKLCETEQQLPKESEALSDQIAARICTAKLMLDGKARFKQKTSFRRNAVTN